MSARIPTLGHVPQRQPHPDVRRSPDAVYTLHAHLIFVTKYRRPVSTDQMLTCCEHLMRGVCADLNAELREFNGETDHVHLLALSARPRPVGVGQPAQRRIISPAAPATPHRSAQTWGKHVWSPSYFAPSCGGAPLTIIKQYIEQQQRPD